MKIEYLENYKKNKIETEITLHKINNLPELEKKLYNLKYLEKKEMDQISIILYTSNSSLYRILQKNIENKTFQKSELKNLSEKIRIKKYTEIWIDNLPEYHKKIITLRYIHGVKWKEIAENTNTNIGKVFRTLKKIKQDLGG